MVRICSTLFKIVDFTGHKGRNRVPSKQTVAGSSPAGFTRRKANKDGAFRDSGCPFFISFGIHIFDRAPLKPWGLYNYDGAQMVHI